MTGALILWMRQILIKLPLKNDQYCWLPFVQTAIIAALCFIGLGYSFFPFIIPDQMLIVQASSANESLIIILICVFTIFLAHVVEIWLFGLGYYFSSQLDGIGNLFGKTANHGIILDYVYLSFVTYTTLGYGDLVASGYLRYLTGVEALVGLILITWSASFLFMEMGKYWRVKK